MNDIHNLCDLPPDIITYIIDYSIEDRISLMNFRKTCKIINKKITNFEIKKKYYLISIIEICV
jgi:hypothetical protein